MPIPPLTDKEVEEVRDVLLSLKYSRRFGRWIWKGGIAIGAAIAGVAALKDQLISLFHR